MDLGLRREYIDKVSRLLFAIGTSALAGRAAACVCAQPRESTPLDVIVRDRAGMAGAVFEATIVSVADDELGMKASAIVRRVWKGHVPSRLTIFQPYGDCQFGFVVNETYVVFTRYGSGSAANETSLCNGNFESNAASPELQYLGRSYPPAPSFAGIPLSQLIPAVATVALGAAVWYVRTRRAGNRQA